MTYGLRWEVDPSPRVSAGQAAIGTEGSNPNDISAAALVPAGKPFYPTSWSNLAPRLGIAWQILDGPKRKTVLRVGAGQFFDLGQGSLEGDGFQANAISLYANQPVGSFTGGILVSETTPPLSLSDKNNFNALFVSRGYKLPYTWEWNATLEESIGQQTFSMSYLGALGRRLVGWTRVLSGGNEFLTLNNDTSSSYHAHGFNSTGGSVPVCICSCLTPGHTRLMTCRTASRTIPWCSPIRAMWTRAHGARRTSTFVKA